MTKSAFVGEPPEKSTVLLGCASCILTLLAIADVFSTLIALWKAFNINS